MKLHRSHNRFIIDTKPVHPTSIKLTLAPTFFDIRHGRKAILAEVRWMPVFRRFLVAAPNGNNEPLIVRREAHQWRTPEQETPSR